jgi:hypothetical protein
MGHTEDKQELGQQASGKLLSDGTIAKLSTSEQRRRFH